MDWRRIDPEEIRMKSLELEQVPEDIRIMVEEQQKRDQDRQDELRKIRIRRALWGIFAAYLIAEVFDYAFVPKTYIWEICFPVLSMILAHQVVMRRINHLFSAILAGILGFGYPIVGYYLKTMLPQWGVIFFSVGGYICFYSLLSMWGQDRRDLEENPY